MTMDVEEGPLQRGSHLHKGTGGWELSGERDAERDEKMKGGIPRWEERYVEKYRDRESGRKNERWREMDKDH